MGILQDRLSTTPELADWLDPDIRSSGVNTDWEAGPRAPEDTSKGLRDQAWNLTFAAGTFTITPETTGSPVIVLTGQDSIQCSFAFDQVGRPTLAWVDSSLNGHLYWYSTVDVAFIISDFPVTFGGVALSLDDKRIMQTGASDILFWYTLWETDHYALYHKKQRDRYETAYPMVDPAPWQYIRRTGMHKGLRGQVELSSVP